MADTHPPPLPVPRSPLEEDQLSVGVSQRAVANSAAGPAAGFEESGKLLGRQVGDYRIVRLLGRGGMADVYLAEQSSLGRLVALKVLKGDLAAEDSAVQRFHREARAAALLIHANIVQIYEVGCVDGVHFIALEYVRGRNLKQLLTDQKEPLQVSLAVRILRQTASALHKASQHQIVHRDIKPENIMLSNEGDVKVADFGLARVQAEADLGLTQDNMTMGTPLYMSPEQAQGDKLDPRSDIYSLGVTTFEMLAGRPPFSGDTALSVALQHVQCEPPQLDTIRPDLPDRLCTVVHKMLAKAPVDRQQSAAELLKELRTAIEDDKIDDAAWPEEILAPSGSKSAMPLAPSSAGIPAASSASVSAVGSPTQQLAAVMRTQANQTLRPGKPVWPWVLPALLLAFLTGGVIAWLTAPRPLLNVDATTAPDIPRMKTVTEQYYYASVVRTLAAWDAIGVHFPPQQNAENQRYARLAVLRKAELFVQQEKWKQALREFSTLAELEASEAELVTFGLAGQALAHWHLGNQQQAAITLAQVLAPQRRRHLRANPLLNTAIRELSQRRQQPKP